MTEPVFETLIDNARVTARPDGLWTLVLSWIEGVAVLRITVAEGQTWKYGQAGEMCGAGGVLKAGDKCLVAIAPVGALVGKLGGSDADDTTTMVPALGVAPATPTFAVGNHCFFMLPAGFQGPLFLTMNDVVGNFAFHAGEIQVTVDGLRVHQTS